MSLTNLQNDEVAFRKFKLIIEMFKAKTAWLISTAWILSVIYSMVKKWQTMIEAHVDVKTTNGYLLHLFCVGN